MPWWRPQAYYDAPGRGTLARDGGGVLLTQAIHSLDLMLSLLGPVAEVAAVAGTSRLHRMEAEDVAAAGITFANGALGSLYATTAAFPGRPERLAVTGTQAAALIDGNTLELSFPTDAASGTARPRAAAAAPTRWRSLTAGTRRSSPTSWTASTRVARRVSPAARRCACTG